ncbi:hypothetical protein [Kitasatospora sp. NPDC047058]|uniref:hypothetical protein n=1 Tax=Kitasatospora sp. NPDC047058 TaxID=3155620 RepID=UPI0033CC48C9
MRFGQFLSGAAHAAANIHRTPTQRAVDAARREHDEWARTAQLGVTYYSMMPTLTMVENGRSSHSSYVFDRRANWLPYTGQLMAGQTPSWAVWQQCGPLTEAPQWTHGQERGRLQELDDRMLADLQRQIARQYPATADLLAA